jgi:hypothetical protein
MLLDAIRQLELRRDAALESFTQSLYKFKDEEKATPDDIAHEYITAESKIAKLQTAQAFYNTIVKLKVDVPGAGKMDYWLSEAIKLVGGAGRLARLWKSALPQSARPRFGLYASDVGPRVRKKEEEYQIHVLTKEEILIRAKTAVKFSGALRAAIARGNTEEWDIPWLSPSDLEV